MTLNRRAVTRLCRSWLFCTRLQAHVLRGPHWRAMRCLTFELSCPRRCVLLARGRKIAHWPWSGQATHAVAGQLERVVRPRSAELASGRACFERRCHGYGLPSLRTNAPSRLLLIRSMSEHVVRSSGWREPTSK